MKSSVHRIGILFFILVGAILSWPMAERAEAVRANTAFTVNSLNDSDDGVCDSSHCSLREAINAANAQNGADTITFSVEGTITLGSTLPQITSQDELTISAEPRTVAISGDDSVRIFSVASGASLTLTGLALVHGNIAGNGGAIYNWGALDIDRCSVAAGGEWQVTRSTFYQNSASTHGGAISHGNGTANVTICTLTGNTAPVGSAIINTSGWTVNVVYCTIAGNSNSTEGSIHNQSGVLSLSSTIVADSEGGPNCSGTIRGGQDYFGEGHNIDSGSSCGWGANRGSMSNTDPRLLFLANNGGATDTMAIRAGSPAINAGDATNCAIVATDQRGVSRPVGSACDIGAFELPAGLPFINLLLDE